MNKLFGNNVTNFFSILGAIGTLLSTYIVYYAFFTDSENLSSTGISRIQEAAATVMAPSGFTVKPALLSKVPNNADFSSGINKPILVTDAEIPFMITEHSGADTAFIKVDGTRWNMGLGDKRAFANSRCHIWLYSIQNETYSFKMDCT